MRQEEPTEWVNSSVVQKPTCAVRLCIDPRDLNLAIKRPHYPMKTIDEVASGPQGDRTFSILDDASGFWQLKLDEESSRLCTFNTPIGRYRFTRLPFGVKCAPEIFQRTMDPMVEALDGVEAIMDDVIAAGDETTHDERLQKFLERASKQGLKLNKEKCKIRQTQVSYVGHLLASEGLKIDPRKVKAVQEMPEPQSKEDVKRLLGFVQFLSRYLPSLSTVNTSLRELEKADVLFHWDHPQKESFEKIKKLVSEASVLQYYDVTKPVKIQCDASGKSLEQCYYKTKNLCVMPLERLQALSQGMHTLKLTCWQLSSLAASSTSTSMAEVFLWRRTTSRYKQSVPNHCHKLRLGCRECCLVYEVIMLRFVTFPVVNKSLLTL